MEAESADALPAGPYWLYEPKRDGFRSLVFKDKASVRILRWQIPPWNEVSVLAPGQGLSSVP